MNPAIATPRWFYRVMGRSILVAGLLALVGSIASPAALCRAASTSPATS